MVLSWEDIHDDLEATAKARAKLAAFDGVAIGQTAAEAADRRVWAARARLGALPDVILGRTLIDRCEIDTRTRYRTLICIEPTFPPDSDHGFLIVPACQILESELARVLVEPARSVAGDLVAALQESDSHSTPADILARWAGGEVPTTLGVTSLVLLAVRRGLEQGRSVVTRFVESAVTAPVRAALRGREFGQHLDKVRTKFRNPACHGMAIFGQEEYTEFAILLVTRRRIADWDSQGANGGGVLHDTLASRPHGRVP